MGKLFGTDGVRGLANSELTCQMVYRLGQAAVKFLGNSIVIGKDTRISGDMLEAAASAGIMSAGGTALLAGVIPTPGVAFLVRDLVADGGLVISASHNPPAYNGIKLFDSHGFKLPDEVENAIEDFVIAGGLEQTGELVEGDEVGIAVPIEDATERYIDHAIKSVTDQGIDFSGLHIALDTGHGASSLTSATALERLGAKVSVINDDFNGCDINVDCGSTNLGALEAFLKETHADIGIAHDGDADRVMLMTPNGEVIDGDFIAATLALDMHERGVLAGNTVVSTVMCNIGFTKAMAEAGIDVVQTKVGDRYVLEEMRANDYVVGGEQSGHMILAEYNSTGDGLITACQYIAAMIRSGRPLSAAASVMVRYPQELVNVRVADKSALADNEAIRCAIADAETELGDDGRVLVRPSGTEPLVRVMVEASTKEHAASVASFIASVVEQQLG